jgi:TonB family protein
MMLTSLRFGLLVLVLCTAQSIYAQPDTPYTAAKIVHTPSVSVPEEAKKTGLGGEVRVGVTIDREGKVVSVIEASGPGYVCRQVAREDVVAIRNVAKDAAKLARFQPATPEADRSDVARTTVYLKFPVPEIKSERDGKLQRISIAGADDSKASAAASGIINNALVLPKPSYPPAARAVRASGVVRVSVLIDENGEMFSAEPVSGHPLLRSAAREAACGARFSPTLLDGKPVKVNGIISYNFVP